VDAFLPGCGLFFVLNLEPERLVQRCSFGTFCPGEEADDAAGMVNDVSDVGLG
jgi:hypothetical protein